MWQLDDIHELLETDEVLTCIRQGRGVPGDVTYVDGLPTASHAAATFQIVCTIQPMGGRDLLLVPEAFRAKDMLSCWQAHRTPDEDVVRLDVTDIVLFRGTAYQVQGAEDWESYTKAVLCAIDVGSFDGVVDPSNLPVLYPATPMPAPEPTPAPTPDPTPNPTPDPTPTPTPTPTPVSEDLMAEIGPMTINTFFSPGDLHNCQIPGDSNGSDFLYLMPRAGSVTGYTMTGQANASPYGAYLHVYTASTAQAADAIFVDPNTQPGFNSAKGQQVVFTTPVALQQGDVFQLKIKIKDGNFSQVDVMCYVQVQFSS